MARSITDQEQAAQLMKEADANTDALVLTPEQTLIMFALVARQGSVAQNDLGAPVDAADRLAIEEAKLITTVKREQNALWLLLTDEGWNWLEANLRKAVPPAHSVMHHLMMRIHRHLKKSGETMREFIGEIERAEMDPELTGSKS